MTDEPTLRDAIDTALAGQVPPQVTAMIDRMADELRRSGAVPGLAVGEPAPGFEAPDARGNVVRLDDRLAVGPVVVCFYRGAWCPICNLQLRSLQAVLPELRAAGAALLAISPQAPDDSLTLAETLGLGFDVLSDVDQSIAGTYRVKFELTGELRALYEQIGMPLTDANADRSWNLPVPATFVLDRDGIVRARHVDPDYRTRMEPAEILDAVARLGDR